MIGRLLARSRGGLRRLLTRRRGSLLLDPDGFFRERPALETLRLSTTVALLAGLVAMATTVLLGWIAYWTFEDGLAEAGYDSSAFLGDLYVGLPMLFSAVVLGWVAVTIAFQYFSWLADGDGSFLGTVAVAGWGMCPLLLEFGVRAVLVYATFRGLAFDGDPDRLLELAMAAGDRTAERYRPLSIVVTVWQAWIWTAGLVHARSIDPLRAAAISGMVAGGVLAVTLVA